MAFLFVQKNDIKKGLKRLVAFSLIFCFICEQACFAQVIAVQPPVHTSSAAIDKFRPLHLRSVGLEHAGRGLDVGFDTGDAKPARPAELENAARNMMTHFFIGLRLPNSSFWVNLRPDSPDRIIDDALAQTDVGRIMLAADVQLKKDLARYTSPRTKEGREYWDKLYKKAGELFGNEDISIPTVTRPWIVPNEIILRDAGTSAYIYKATLKVLLESDHLAGVRPADFGDSRISALNDYSSLIIKEKILPKLSRDVNISKRYAPLRQVYYSLILAHWFKSNTAARGACGIDQKDLSGLMSQNAWSKDAYFEQYQESFHKGEYNIEESVRTPYGQNIRQYFSGGIQISQLVPGGVVRGPASMPAILSISADPAVMLPDAEGLERATVIPVPGDFEIRFRPEKTSAALENSEHDRAGAPGSEGLSTVEDNLPSSGAPAVSMNDGGNDDGSGDYAAEIAAAVNKIEKFSYKFAGAAYESLEPLTWKKKGWDFTIASVDYVRGHVPFEYIPRSKKIPAKLEFIITEMLENAYDAIASRCDSKYLTDNNIILDKNRDGYITAGFTVENTYLVFTVHDNGMGRNAAPTHRKQELKETLYRGGRGLAMQKLRELSADINGKFELVFENGLTRTAFYFPLEYIELKSRPMPHGQREIRGDEVLHGEKDGGILSDGKIRTLFEKNVLTPAPDRELRELIKKASEYFEITDLEQFIKDIARLNTKKVTVISDHGPSKEVYWFGLRRALARLPEYARTARQAGLEYDESFHLLSRAAASLRHDFEQPSETIDALIYAVSVAGMAGVDWDFALPALHELMDFCRENDVVDQALVCFGRGLEIGFSVEGICRTIRKLPDEDGTMSGYVFPSFIEALGSIRPARLDPALLERAFDILAGDRPYFHNKYNPFIAFLYGSVSQDMMTPGEVLQKIITAANDREGIFPLGDGQENNIRQTSGSRERLWLDMGNSPLVNRLLPYRTIRSWEQGMEDLAGLMQVRDHTIEGIDIREGAWLFAPETQTWYSLGGKTEAKIGGVRHIMFPCDVSHLSNNPAFVHIHPESLEILIGPLPQQLDFPRFHKKITKFLSSMPSGTDFEAIASFIRRDSSRTSNISAYIVHSLGITEIKFPHDVDALAKFAEGFRDLKDQVMLDFDVQKYYKQYGDSETSFDFVRRFFPVINSRLPPGFSISLYGFEGMPPGPSHGEMRKDGGEEKDAPLTIEDYQSDIAAAAQRGDIIRYSAGESVDEFSPEEGLKTTNSRGLRREYEFEEGKNHEDGWIILNTLLDNIPAGSELSVLEIGPGFGRTCYDMYQQIKNRNAAPHIETIGLTPIPARMALQRSAHWIRQRIADIVLSKKIDGVRGLRGYLSGLKSYRARNLDELAIEDMGPVLHETRTLPLDLVFALQEGGENIFKRLDEPYIAQQHIARLDEVAPGRQFDLIYDQWGGFYYSVLGADYQALQAALEKILPLVSDRGIFFAAVLHESLMKQLKYVSVPRGYTVAFYGPRNSRRLLAVRQGSMYEKMLQHALSPSRSLGDIYMIDGVQDLTAGDEGIHARVGLDGGSEPLTFSRYTDDIALGIENGTIGLIAAFKDRFSPLHFGIDPTNTRRLSSHGAMALDYVLSRQAPAQSTRILVLGPGIGRECADMKDRARAIKKSVMIDTISLNPISPHIRLVRESGELLSIMKTEVLSGRVRHFLTSESAYHLNVLSLESLFELHRLGYRIFEKFEEPYIDHQTVAPFLEAQSLSTYDLVYDNCGGFFYTAQQHGVETALEKLLPFLKDEGIFYTEGLPWIDFADHDIRIPEGCIMVVDKEKGSFILLKRQSTAARRIIQYLNNTNTANENILFAEYLGEVLYDLQSMSYDGGAGSKDVAGVDFRSLQPAPGLSASGSAPDRAMGLEERILAKLGKDISGIHNADPASEWLKVEKSIKLGFIPGADDITGYVRQCCRSGCMSQERSKVLLAIARILRLEEDFHVTTEPRLKELLVLLDSPV
ncbi:MAG TPA: hypothetical protein PLP56_00105 [Candidatus Omnitrophota bacterium]|nr:hypothetical protein [Candidatus Omnitrophota bacterium]HQQ05364.1 hypothetical protein [Candidatus Omnitrophota bacterium]